jgi:amidase
MFERYDIFVTPSSAMPTFDVNRTHSETIDDVKLANFMAGSALNTAMTKASCAAVAIPAGFDQYGRPVACKPPLRHVRKHARWPPRCIWNG